MKNRHNKKRNTAFLFEVLVRELTSSIVKKDNSRKQTITDILKESNDSTTCSDCLKLSSLYADLATLVELDGEDQVVKDTATIKEANSLSGKMLRLNIKDKYPGLAEAAKDLVVAAIGEDDVALDEKTRSNAVDAFRALSRAFYEGGQ